METSKDCTSSKAKTVFITGAASGIGRATAIVFARRGWDVVGHYFSSRKYAMSLVSEVQGFGRNCEVIQGDLCSDRGIAAIIETVRSFRIDSLINNAGSYVVQKHFTGLTYETLLKVFTLNTFAPILLSAAVFEEMKKNGFGRIVNISSIAAKYGGSAFSVHYGCSKRALEGLSQTLSREGAAHNVLVNTIRPGVIDTDFHKKHPKNMDDRIDMIPLKRMGTADEVAVSAYQLGSEINTFITNETIAVSGGE